SLRKEFNFPGRLGVPWLYGFLRPRKAPLKEFRELTMSLYCGTACRRKFFGGYRLLSTYVTKTRNQNIKLERLLGKFGQDSQILEDSVLIGCSEQQEARFALDLGLNSSSSIHASLQKAEVETALQGSFIKLTKALFELNVKDASLLSTAQALLRWHDAHQFCSRSGQPTKKNVSGSKRVCPSNNIIYYPQVAPVVITLVSDGTRCLLVRQSSFPKGMYSALAGFCDIGESLEETVRREIAEEVGLEVDRLHYSASQHWPFPHSTLMIACHATVKPGQTD
ncbi:NUDT13, partial [Cervus elaphus hippelaphus]